jgi:hypothetical protein
MASAAATIPSRSGGRGRFVEAVSPGRLLPASNAFICAELTLLTAYQRRRMARGNRRLDCPPAVLREPSVSAVTTSSDRFVESTFSTVLSRRSKVVLLKVAEAGRIRNTYWLVPRFAQTPPRWASSPILHSRSGLRLNATAMRGFSARIVQVGGLSSMMRPTSSDAMFDVNPETQSRRRGHRLRDPPVGPLGL